MTEAIDAIAVEHNGAVMRIALNRPDRLNALTPDMLMAARDAIAAAPQHGVRAILLEGRGRAFCAGADLTAAGGMDPGEKLLRYYNPLIGTIMAAPVPVVVALQGVAAGGGAGLALTADIVVMERTARFTFPFARLGLVPDVGVTAALARTIGKARALDLLLCGDDLSAEQAHGAGLVSRIVDEGCAVTEAALLCDRLAAMPTVALGMIRAQVQAAFERPFADSLALEAAHQSRAGQTRDFREGVAAFRERRKPAFEGR